MSFYFIFLNIYYWEKLTFSKLNGNLNFSKRKFEEIHQLWRTKKFKVYLGKRLFWHYYLQLFFVYKTVSQISFKSFCLGGERLLSEFLRKWGWFQGQWTFPSYSGLKIKISKNWDNELWQNDIEKQIMLFETTVNCLFNDYDVLVIDCFDWRIGIFSKQL